MAHTCPECGNLCHCSGDIDDINMGEWIGCKHWIHCEGEDSDDEDDFYDYDDEGLTTTVPKTPKP